jgi:hypothetical protein
MKKILVIMMLMVCVAVTIHAQEYKLQKSSGTLGIVEVGSVVIEGYAGNEIIFSRRGGNRDDDERAKGLRAISGMGLEDNTGIGLSVIDKGDVIEVQQLRRADGPDITIKVPHGVKVLYTQTSPHGDDIEVKNYEGTLDISTVHSDVKLNNVTGPMEVKTVHGDVDASLGAALKNRVSITSVHGHVDVALPVSTKAILQLSSSHGEILVDPDFKIEMDRTGNYVKYSDRVTGKINGGGVSISLTASHDNVYLRKK